MMVKELTAMLLLCNFRRYLLSLVLAVAIVAPALAQQSRTFQYVYDDIGQIKKAIDTTTGECIVYSYDEVGNITAVDRRTNCLAPPTFQSIAPGSSLNCFTVTGQNLLGATVTTDIPGASVTDVSSSDDETSVGFCLSATEQFCNRSGTATITTATGSVDVPVAATGTTPLTPDVTVSSSISTLGEKDLYCFDLAAPTRVVLQSRGLTSGIEACMEVYTGAPATAVPNGNICVVSTVLRLDLTLAAGTYFVLVQDHSSSATGNYNLLFEPIEGGTVLQPDVPVSDTVSPLGDIDPYQFTLAVPTRVVLQSRGLTSGIEACMEVYTGAPATAVPNGNICVVSTVLRLDLTLAAGTYFVLVQDHSSSATGNYNLLLELIEGGTVLIPGTSVADTITPIGDLDLFTFSLTVTKQVTIQVTPSGIQPCIELFKGTPAQPVSGGSTCSNGTAQLNISLDPETYFVLVSDSGNNNTGNYSVLLQVP